MTLGKWLGLLVIIVSLSILWKIRATLFLFLTAVTIATILNRLIRRFRQSNIKRSYAVFLSVIVFLGILVLLISSLFIRLIEQFDQLLSLVSISANQLTYWNHELQSRIPEGIVADLLSLENLTRQLQSIVNWTISKIYLFFSDSLTLILNTLFVLVLAIMLLANPQRYRKGLISAFPAFYRQRADEILTKCEERLVHHIASIGLSIVFVSIASTIGLLVLQIPLPLVNGLLAGLFAFIPYIGTIASAIPPLLFALLDDPWKAGAVFLLYFVIQQLQGHVIAPMFVNYQVDPLPAITLTLLITFSTFFGFLGLLLGLPILIVAQTCLEEAIVHDILDRWKEV